MQLAIDDFGTGYSSLAYLTRLPLDALKIDRSFVSELAPGSHTDAVVKAIIAIARSLQMRVVAEGVETERQRELLTGLGVDAIQGFLISRPLSASRRHPAAVRAQARPAASGARPHHPLN